MWSMWSLEPHQTGSEPLGLLIWISDALRLNFAFAVAGESSREPKGDPILLPPTSLKDISAQAVALMINAMIAVIDIIYS